MKHQSCLALRVVSYGAIGMWLLGALNACASSSQRIVAEPPVAPPPVAIMAKPFAVTEPWSKLTTEPYKGKQDDIYFVNQKLGFYGNGAGKLFRTQDGGATWKLILEKPGTFVRALGFLDDKRGFLGNIGPDYFPGVTDTTMLYKTADGGDSWQPVALPDAAGARGMCAIDILSVDYINAGKRDHREVVTVAGRVGGPGAAFRSEDGGGTWQRLTLPADVAMILDVHFLDVNTGFLFAADNTDVEKSHGYILRTTDSGRSWQPVYRSTRPFELVWKASFPTKQVGFATLQSYNEDPSSSQRLVLKTTDGGASWQELPMVNDENLGWVGAAPQGYVTKDGGATWAPEPAMGVATNKIRIVKPDSTVSADGRPMAVMVVGIGLNIHRAMVNQ
jgi:photosystem II stability/assembly factor-like uncharacterized protein